MITVCVNGALGRMGSTVCQAVEDDSELTDDIVWPDKKLLCSKYSKFLNMDTEKYLKILKNNLNLLA